MARKIILDANVGLLFLQGLCNSGSFIPHRRLQSFDQRHLDTLNAIILQYDKIVLTTYCLAELWNLIGEHRKKWDLYRENLIGAAKGLILDHCEIYDPAIDLIAADKIGELGLADVSILFAARKGCDLITIDGDLFGFAASEGIGAFPLLELVRNS
jgi:hypothetical protein